MTIQDALIKTVYSSGKQQKEIASELGMSPSELSRMCSADEGNRIKFPLEKLPALIKATGNLVILEVIADEVGAEVREKSGSMEQRIDNFEKDFLKKVRVFLKFLESFES